MLAKCWEGCVPCFSSRVQWSLKPAEVAGLEFIVDTNEMQVCVTGLLVDSDGSVTSMVSAGNRDALGFEVDQRLHTGMSAIACDGRGKEPLTAYEAARPEAKVMA